MSKKKSPILAYLEGMHMVHGTGKATAEQSYKSKLEALLTAIGEDFDPELFANPELKQEGAGQPDFGIFEKKSRNLRLVVEVKSTKDNIHDTASGDQVSKYWNRYGFVLVTNFREFLLVARDAETGEPRIETRYRLSATSEAFWKAKPAKLAEEHEQGLTDYLAGVFARPSPILKPKDLAADLARHAREAKRRLARHAADDLKPLQDAFEAALGLSFEDEKGLDFFRSSLVQTLFYGLFSGWMLWRQSLPKGKKPPIFDWKDASEHLVLPLIGDLFEEVARPRRLKELDLREPLEWAAGSLRRVNHAEFFKSFDADHAITLFYEPFLQAFDPELRKQLGVWYTPPEIVTYMVERVDQLLRSELGIADGLADDNVYVLDPATGTGSYVMEVARRIHKTLQENGAGSLVAAGVKKALTTRVFGFEILPAPYVVAHLQLGVLLRSLGSPLSGKERTGVYLTNALTGWEPPKGVKQTSAFKFLTDEQDAAAKVKREKPIIVILGNPPYNGYAGVALDEEADLIEPYKHRLYEDWRISKNLLDDLYIRFFRLAERKIGAQGSRGVVCYISNYSWLDGLSHPVMRKHIVENFDQVYIDNCNGDKYRTGKRTPDGKPDQSMFTTDQQAVGIQVGTAIATLVKIGKSPRKNQVAAIAYRDFWGTGNEKRAALLSALSPSHATVKYEASAASKHGRYAISFRSPTNNYESWTSVSDLYPRSHSGVKTNCDELVIDIDRDVLVQRMTAYCNKSVSWNELIEAYPKAAESRPDYDAHEGRTLHQRNGFEKKYILPILYRPFDLRWVYNTPVTKIINSPRPAFVADLTEGQLFLECRQKLPTPEFDRGLVCHGLGETMGNGTSTYFPLLVPGLQSHANVADRILTSAASANKRASTEDLAYAIFFHTIGLLWSPAYRTENEAALRQDWPRVPVPKDAKVLEASAALGRTVADLLLPDKPVPGVTTGKLRAELKTLAMPTKIGGTTIDPDNDLEVTATWGFRGQGNAVMSGKGKVMPNEADPDGAVDVYINDAVCWRNVPRDVWEMTIGGYPVVKKWLSYREHRVLGRPLTLDEMTYITNVVRRLKAMLLLGPELDANYRACAKETITLK